jgi:hypothetical protein
MGPRSPIQTPATTIKAEEPWMVLTIEKHKVSLLTNTGVNISAIPFSSRSRASKKKLLLGHIRPGFKGCLLLHSLTP